MPGHGECSRVVVRVPRSARLPPSLGHFDDDHAPSTTGAWWAEVVRPLRLIIREGEVGLARAAGEQAVVADAMEAARQDVEKEASNELVGSQVLTKRADRGRVRLVVHGQAPF